MRMPGYSAGSSLVSSIAQRKRPIVWVSEVCECAGACYLVTTCLGTFCVTQTICDPCAYVYNCKQYAAPE
jgi:hypothetical protein